MGLWNDGGFFLSVKGHVIKWWQFALQPILRINNNGRRTQYMTQEQPGIQPQVQPMPQQEVVMQSSSASPQMKGKAEEQMSVPQEKLKDTSASVESGGGVSASEDPMEVLCRINEEKEMARRKEIEAAKEKASEQARIAAIMNANKVDVNAFIAAGIAAKEERASEEAETEKLRKQEEDMRKAQEIMERLNREAAEDEAKKQAEIEQARQEAMKQFG